MSSDLGVIIAIVAVGIAMIASIMAMMFWCRQESNALRAEAKEDRKDLLQISRNLENTVRAIQSELREFNEKIIRIEERRL